MTELNNMLFALLRSVLCGEELNRSEFSYIDDAMLEKLYALSNKHDMAHIVGVALEKNGFLNDGEISARFSKQQYTAVFRYENIKYEQDRICQVLDEVGIAYIPLKGMLIRELYPEPWMRTSCDIDVLVRERDVDRASEALVKVLDYVKDPRKSVHDVLLLSPSGVHLELHYGINENIPEIDCVLDRVWDYASPLDENRSECRLTKEFFIFHFIAHASYHFVHGGCGLRTLFDLYLLLNEKGYDYDKTVSLCREGNLDKFFSALSELAQVWFGGREHSQMTLRTEKYILSGGTYGTKESEIAALQEVRGGKLGYVFSRVFVSYKHLKFKYPSLKSKALVPIYQVRRWIDAVKDKKTSVYVREFNTNNNLNKNKIDEVGSLMHDLNLNRMIK